VPLAVACPNTLVLPKLRTTTATNSKYMSFFISVFSPHAAILLRPLVQLLDGLVLLIVSKRPHLVLVIMRIPQTAEPSGPTYGYRGSIPCRILIIAQSLCFSEVDLTQRPHEIRPNSLELDPIAYGFFTIGNSPANIELM
jgi:hypothetical protein